MAGLSKAEHEKAVKRIMSASALSRQQPATKQWPKTGLWSEEEVNLLKELYEKKGAQYIADKLGRSLGSVTRKACNIGITGACIVWSSREEQLLRELYGKKNVENVAKTIGRSVAAIRGKAYKLGLMRKNWR